MLNNLPNNIVKYLVDELPPYTGLLIFKTDTQSNIIDFHGPYNVYFEEKPEINKPLHDYILALHSMIPPLVSPMCLKKIQLNNSAYVDIHILDEDNEYWIILVDQSRETENIRDILQKINETKLEAETKGQTQANIPFSHLDIFDYLSIKVHGKGGDIIGKIPKWFKQFRPELTKKKIPDFVEIFPYLEVFMIEAEDFWLKKEDGKIKSGIWSETKPDGTDIFLRAFAIKHDSQNFIVISNLDDKIDNEQMAYQLGRDQKLAYEKLEKAEQKLRLLLDYKEKFVSIISHDLRSPVAAVLGIAEMLVNDEAELSKLDDFYREMILSIKEEMLRLLDYNDKLYHWSNLELGNFEIVKEEVDLEKIITTTERTAEKKLKAKNISFSYNFDKGETVNVDLTLFLQVLNNLMANAIKFTPENGNISINVSHDPKLQIAVIDSGVGMPENISKNIFSGFARSSTMGTEGEKGTGLGLGIVKKIIDAHEFTIHVESEEGKGSKFIISL